MYWALRHLASEEGAAGNSVGSRPIRRTGKDQIHHYIKRMPDRHPVASDMSIGSPATGRCGNGMIKLYSAADCLTATHCCITPWGVVHRHAAWTGEPVASWVEVQLPKKAPLVSAMRRLIVGFSKTTLPRRYAGPGTPPGRNRTAAHPGRTAPGMGKCFMNMRSPRDTQSAARWSPRGRRLWISWHFIPSNVSRQSGKGRVRKAPQNKFIVTAAKALPFKLFNNSGEATFMCFLDRRRKNGLGS
ncbi:uncharacterized protein EI90DRAFT_3014272 [Cantharellus anzutake]|uniref:uncharacterized protein n=1 Tax=Cantharellus anzutake TaxID=1750568 RepID=UPI0019034628|nr:uncharacterized protein EI90DRAFT_3014272 [Cantharellus anzutake]KAF8336566.1 hypothetical protein EI90DRAFT_3014272 [Cantharellus anzutake]